MYLATPGLLITTGTTVKEKEWQIKKVILHIDLLAEVSPSDPGVAVAV